jgi:hypothetical protein
MNHVNMTNLAAFYQQRYYGYNSNLRSGGIAALFNRVLLICKVINIWNVCNYQTGNISQSN